MKLLRSGQEKFLFEISREEMALLRHVLKRYPLVPATHHRLSHDRHIRNRDENQHLLEEALKAQRLENRQQLEFLLNEPNRFVECAAGWRVGFSRGEIEWLLQVLNDVRIGSWLALGSPDQQQEIQKRRNQQTAQLALTMDLAACFEMAFLQAINGDL